MALNRNQRAFVQVLIDNPGLSYRDAAARAGVSARAGYRYSSDPEVQRALSEAQRIVLAGVLRKAITRMESALSTLADIAGDVEAPATARVAAARAILSEVRSLVEFVDLAAAVTALERAVFGEGEL